MRKLSIDEHIANFWRRINKSEADSCWLWTAGKDDQGYGKGTRGRIIYDEERAHRIAYILTKTAIPKGMDVLHRCDNPSCCNPAHLFLGTQADNNADMFKKGRWKPHPIGDKNPRAKLTAIAAQFIYQSDLPQKQLAEQFDVSLSVIEQIKAGRAWVHATKGLDRGGRRYAQR